jgi:hypothetical protein
MLGGSDAKGREMNAKRFGINVTMAGLALALGGVGCSGAGGDGSQVQGEDVDTEASKLVHSIDAGNGHTLEFYDLGEGQVGTKEQYVIGDKPLLDDAVELEGRTLAETFRYVRPDSLVPEAIVAADAHAADTLSKPQVIRPMLPKPAASEEEVGMVQSAAGCSLDLLNDNWSAQWFAANFGEWTNYNCGGDFVNTLHAENQPSTWAKAGGKYVWLWKGFEGDHNVSGSFVIYRNGVGLPANLPLGSGSIPPRNVVQWTIRGGWDSQTNHADSKSWCGHAGYAMVWCGI